MIELWPFQKTLVKDLRSALQARYRAPLLVSPTGSGKTVMFSFLTGRFVTHGFRSVILAHRKELLDQISGTLNDFAVPHETIAPGIKYNDKPLAHVASVFSVVRRLDKIVPPDYVIVDEAHHAIQGSTWGKVIKRWRESNSRLRLIGVTATPERLSGEGLDGTFDSLIMGPTVRQLIEQQYLSPYKMFAPPRQVNLEGVHRRMGDFVKSETEAVMDKPSIMGDAVQHYKQHLNGAPTVGFCVSVKHAEHVAENYRANGFQAAAIHGGLTRKERDEMTRDFAAGRLNYMASCDLISEGYDVKGIIGCQNLRPTESLAMCLQQWGRALRYVQGKTAIILDHVGNSARHGLPDQDREWTLAGRDKKRARRNDPDDISIRQCGTCGAINRISAIFCSECKTRFATKPRKIETVSGTLEEITAAEKVKFEASAAGKKKLNALINLGRMRGYKNPEGWARHVFHASNEKEIKKRVKRKMQSAG